MSCYMCAGKIFKIEILNVFLYEKKVIRLKLCKSSKTSIQIGNDRFCDIITRIVLMFLWRY